MSSSYRQELDKWLRQLDVKAGQVLDIGGSQLPVKGRTKTWDVGKYLIADLPEPHVGSPKPDIILDMNQQILTPDALSNKKKDNPYWGSAANDIVFCLEVFEYVWNPVFAMFQIKFHLVDGGTAWVTFPSLYPIHQPVADDALRYMPGGIKKLADKTGLKIKQIIPRKTETDAIYRAFMTERMRCAKGEDHNVSGYIVEFQK